MSSLRTPVDLNMASPVPELPLVNPGHLRTKPPPLASPSSAVVTANSADDIRTEILTSSTPASLHTASRKSSLVFAADDFDRINSEPMSTEYPPRIIRHSPEPMLEHATPITATAGIGGRDNGDTSGITRAGLPAPQAALNPRSDNSPVVLISPTTGMNAVGDAMSSGSQASKLAKLQRYAIQCLTYCIGTFLTVRPQLHADRHLDCEYDSANAAYPHQVNDRQTYTVLQTYAFSIKCALVEPINFCGHP